MNKNPRLIDMTGKTIGNWTVVSQAGNTRGGGATWNCICSCKNEKVVLGADIRKGKSLSCGCKGSQSTFGERTATHRMKGTRIHTCWSNMHRRCKDKTNKHYGGKGISVCQEWKKFEDFLAWANKSNYQENLTIERIDNSKGYCPENCKWATAKEQSRNRSIVHMASKNISFAEIAENNLIPVAIMNNRVSAGKWSHEDASKIKLGSKKRLLPRDPQGKFLPSQNPWIRSR